MAHGCSSYGKFRVCYSRISALICACVSVITIIILDLVTKDMMLCLYVSLIWTILYYILKLGSLDCITQAHHHYPFINLRFIVTLCLWYCFMSLGIILSISWVYFLIFVLPHFISVQFLISHENIVRKFNVIVTNLMQFTTTYVHKQTICKFYTLLPILLNTVEPAY